MIVQSLQAASQAWVAFVKFMTTLKMEIVEFFNSSKMNSFYNGQIYDNFENGNCQIFLTVQK